MWFLTVLVPHATCLNTDLIVLYRQDSASSSLLRQTRSFTEFNTCISYQRMVVVFDNEDKVGYYGDDCIICLQRSLVSIDVASDETFSCTLSFGFWFMFLFRMGYPFVLAYFILDLFHFYLCEIPIYSKISEHAAKISSWHLRRSFIHFHMAFWRWTRILRTTFKGTGP